MKIIFILVVIVSLFSCTTRKTETTTTSDSTAMDSVDILATQPAPSNLAFNPIDGFSLDKSVTIKDSVNFYLLSGQEEVDAMFDADAKSTNPDFLINYIIAVACQPTQKLTTIATEKVEVVGKDINVYLNIQRGVKSNTSTRPVQLFAIEKRSACIAIQFFVNGKKSIGLMLPAE